MHFDWDSRKRASNTKKHGIDFIDLVDFFEADFLQQKLAFADEQRWKAIGSLNGEITTVVYTKRKQKLRIISARKARINEQKLYRVLFER